MAEAMSKADLYSIFERVKNWGRWGAEDERGALNFITPEVRARAAALARDGLTVSCALPLNTSPSLENGRPVLHMVTNGGDVPDATGSGDFFAIATHGYAHTHLDALCHIFDGGKMYNGFPASDVRSTGAVHNAITSGENGVVSRGVLLDVPRTRGLEFLEPGDAIYPRDLEAAEREQGVTVGEGDILLVRTGRHLRRQLLGSWDGRQLMAGLHAQCLPWLHERRVAVLGSDGVSDVMPSGVEDVFQPIHKCAIVAMGLHLLDNAQFDELAAACAERSRYEFLLTLAPLRLLRGTGCPVNPIALF